MTEQNNPLAAIDAEQCVLGALMRDNAGVDGMGDLRTAHFYRADHRTIFAEIIRQVTAGKQCDVITVHEALSGAGKADDIGGLPYLNAMTQNTPSAANISRYADLVRDRALRRALISATGALADMAQNPGSRTASELLDAAQSTLAGLAESRTVQEPELASAALAAHCKVLAGRVEREHSGVATGFKDIDDALAGGPGRGALVIVGARPSQGKTALALNIALHVSATQSALVLSMEMTKGELLDRAIAAVGNISNIAPPPF